jgi:ribose transport system permease protein
MILPLMTAGWDATGLIGATAVLTITTLLGLINGLGIVLLRVHPLILTLATATILQGALILIAGGSAISVNNATAVFLGNGKLLGLPMTICSWIVVALLVTLFLHRTLMGAWLFAIGTNDRAARLAGVAVGPTLTVAYAISGFCAGLAGLLLLGMNRQGYVGIGEPYLLGSIAAVVLGGTSILGGRGTYLGTIAGAVLLVTITALITVVNASAGWRSILFGALILGLLLLSGRDREMR